MRFFTRKSKAIKNWHSRAMTIDLSKTTVTFINTEEPDDHCPPWMRKKNS
jgi:hypothetical protein